MAELTDQIMAMPAGDTNKGILKRYIGSESVQVTVDSAGRICLPEEMAKIAGITDEAVLVGVIDQFEIVVDSAIHRRLYEFHLAAFARLE